MRIVLDTNFLVSANKFKIDLLLELKGNDLFVTQPVLDELEKLAENSGKDGAAARVSLAMVKEKGLKILESKEREADKSILEYGEGGYVIATQDKALREKLKKARAKIMYIRQKKYVVFE